MNNWESTVLQQDFVAAEAIVQNYPDWVLAVYELRHNLERRSLFGEESLRAVHKHLEVLLAAEAPRLFGVRLLFADGRVQALVRYVAQRIGIGWYDFPSESFRYMLVPLQNDAVHSLVQAALEKLWALLGKYETQPTYPTIELDAVRVIAQQTLPSLRALLQPTIQRLKLLSDQELVDALGVSPDLFQKWMQEKPTDELLFDVYHRAAIRYASHIERNWPNCDWLREFVYVEGQSQKPREVYLLEMLFDLPLREMMTEQQQSDIRQRSWLWWQDQPKSGYEDVKEPFMATIRATQTDYLFDNEDIADLFAWLTSGKENYQVWLNYRTPIAGDFTGAKTTYELYHWAHEEYPGRVLDAGFWDWMQLINQLWSAEVPSEWHELEPEDADDDYFEDWDADF